MLQLDNHAGPGLLDYAIVNVDPVHPALRKKYATQQVKPVEVDFDALALLGLEVVSGKLLHESATVRHNPDAVAAVAERQPCLTALPPAAAQSRSRSA